MKIAIFDYIVTANNPAGSCHRAAVKALADEHQFTVFSTQFDNPRPGRVRWVRVRSIRRPLVALFLSFHFAALLEYFRSSLRGRRFGIVQAVESNFLLGDVVYSHFCHRWFLKNRWKFCRPAGARGFLRWLDHALHAVAEPWSLKRARWVVVPSAGLEREMKEVYPFVASKLRVIPNPVDLAAFGRPAAFAPEEFRRSVGVCRADTMVVFVALGHFERKGLRLVFDALARLGRRDWKLVVVGGSPGLVQQYEDQARSMQLGDSVRLVGHQTDVRHFLWSTDLFVMPSVYEVFPLAVLQAAAAGCPILTTNVNGVEEFLDSQNCMMTSATAPKLLELFREFDQMTPEVRRYLGEAAQRSVRRYAVGSFELAWRRFYNEVSRDLAND